MAQDPLHLLCIEPSFPGRLGTVADWLVRKRGYHCRFCCTRTESQDYWPQSTGNGLEVILYSLGGVAREPSVTWNRTLERGLCYAYGCWEMLTARRLRPIDLVLGRSAGFGSSLYFPVFQPETPIVNLFDYYFQPHANDLAEGSGTDLPVEYFHWRRAANAMDLLDLENGVLPWTQTFWQRDLFPAEYRQDFLVLFDGVDADRFNRTRNGPHQRVILGRTIPPEIRVVTCIARNLDRLRGFDRFMELANRLARIRSDILFVVVGGSQVQRGLDVLFYNKDFREHVLLQNPPFDPDRFWFLGSIAPTTIKEVLEASDLHFYPSRPYVVSRSLVEAMAAGCVIIAGDAAPAREFIIPGQNGLLAPVDDIDAWENLALSILENPKAHDSLGQAAATLVREKFSQRATLPLLAKFFDKVVKREYASSPT
jgi:glycosyltransferase involved in cell wall biosynthesis